MLVIDKTLSTYFVHGQIIAFAHDLIGQFRLGPAYIGIVEFDVKANVLSELTDSAAQLQTALENAARPSGKTSISSGLAANGGRTCGSTLKFSKHGSSFRKFGLS